MRRSLKILLCLLLVCATLTGCSSFDEMTQDKTFTVNDLTMTIPGYFRYMLDPEVETTDSFVYTFSDYSIFGVREGFEAFEGQELPTLEEYAATLIKDNALDAEILEQEGILTFTFKGENQSFLCGVFSGSEAYWVVQIGCLEKHYEDSWVVFLDYLKTVVVA